MPDNDSPTEKPSFWEKFFASSSASTLITVVIGGIFGTIITAMVQNIVKTQEESRAEARQVVAARLAAVQNAFSLIGKMMGTAEDLIVCAGPEYDLSRYEGTERERVVAQIHGIRNQYNAVDRDWRTSEYSHGLLLAYYHPDRPEVMRAWPSLANSINDYVACARKWSVAHTTPAPYDGSCDAPRARVDEAIDELSSALARRGGATLKSSF